MPARQTFQELAPVQMSCYLTSIHCRLTGELRRNDNNKVVLQK